MGPHIGQESPIWHFEDCGVGYIIPSVSTNPKLNVYTDRSKKEYNPRPCCSRLRVLQ